MKPGKRQPEDEYRVQADLMHQLQSPSRRRALTLLRDGESRVAELAEKVGLSPSALSHHLTGLRQAHLVETRRDGTNIYYSCSSRAAYAVIDLLDELFGSET